MNNPLFHLRAFLARQGIRAFSAPYLPDRLTVAAALLILLDGLLALASQNDLYWNVHARASSSVPIVQSLLAIHPLVFLAVLLLYSSLAWLILQILTRPLALMAWVTLAFLHLPLIVTRVGQIMRWVPVENDAKINLALPVLAGLLAGGLLSLLLFSPQGVKAAGADPLAAGVGAPRPAAAHRFRRLSWRLGLAGLVVLLLAAGGAWYFNATRGWQVVRPAHSPGSRCCMALAYDTARSRAVLFGGSTEWLGTMMDQTNDTWEWTGSDWVQIETPDRPLARHDASMAYDEARAVMVLFGGMNRETRLNDTWEYDGVNWKQVGLDSFVPHRDNHQLFYDPARQQVVLSGGYGGQDSQGNNLFFPDSYAWDGTSWQLIQTSEPSHVVTRLGYAYDADDQRGVAMEYDYPVTWNGERWIAFPSSGVVPTGRDDSGMAALPGKGVLLFGGLQPAGYSDETWLLTGTSWKQLSSWNHPDARGDFAFFYDPTQKRVFLYGGNNSLSPYLSDMWSFSLP